jgi:SNF2 family DNA or RNA helicase
MRLTTSCPICQKPLAIESEIQFGEEILTTYKCGHSFARPATQVAAGNPDTPYEIDFQSIDGTKTARNYQKEGIEFICGEGQFSEYGQLRGNSVVLADQMRLGKTPQSLLAVRHLLGYGQSDLTAPRTSDSDRGPVLVLARAANIYQWTREVRTWASALPNSVWIIQGGKSWIPPGFQFYICSMDTFSLRGTCKSCKHRFHENECKYKNGKVCDCRVCLTAGDSMADQLLEFGFKFVIADEAHSFKNADSNRTEALVKFMHQISHKEISKEITLVCAMCDTQWQDQAKIELNMRMGTGQGFHQHRSQCPACGATTIQRTEKIEMLKEVGQACQVILLTGTPIKNRADEYFVPLNLVAPERFSSLASFRKNWLLQSGNGSWSRVAPWKWEAFKKYIAPFVLRREKEDVYQDIPKLNRIFTPITIEDERLKKAYNKVIDEIESTVGANGNYKYFSTIGELQKLRQICGLAKVNFVADYAETFLMDSDRQKLAIGYHHHSVRDALQQQLSALGTCKLDGQDSPARKDFVAHKYFQTAPEQILLLGTMAAKEGLELPYIDTALVCEREWSSADEEQFEFRFYNPDQDYLRARGLENKITNIEYIVAKGTVDEFFYDLVESKRLIFGETVSTNWDITTDSASFQQLMERTVAGRL